MTDATHDREYDGARTLSPEEMSLPSELVERIYQAVRLAGLPLAVETGDAGVYLMNEGNIGVPVDHVVITWHTTKVLCDETDLMVEPERPHSPHAAKLVSAVYSGMDNALATILTAAGMVVAPHPYTHSLVVWGIDGPPPM